MSHTPEPWRIVCDHDGDNYVNSIRGPQGGLIADCNMAVPDEKAGAIGCGTDDPEANALLIMAAPRMLREIEYAIVSLSQSEYLPTIVLRDVIEHLRAAMTLAKERQP